MIESAKETALKYLAQRDHSEQELLRKLGRRFDPAGAAEAVAFVRDGGWLTPPRDMTERLVAELGRRGKGRGFIDRCLLEKGLPPAPPDRPDELRKAREFARSRVAHALPYDREERIKLNRWLLARGFDEDVIAEAIGEAGCDATERE